MLYMGITVACYRTGHDITTEAHELCAGCLCPCHGQISVKEAERVVHQYTLALKELE